MAMMAVMAVMSAVRTVAVATVMRVSSAASHAIHAVILHVHFRSTAMAKFQHHVLLLISKILSKNGQVMRVFFSLNLSSSLTFSGNWPFVAVDFLRLA